MNLNVMLFSFSIAAIEKGRKRLRNELKLFFFRILINNEAFNQTNRRMK